MAESSREEISKLEALYANNPEGRVFTHLAEAYRKAGELERAHQILEQGLTKHAGYASAHVVLGRVLMDEAKGEEAAEAFRRVLGLDPHNHVALRCLGDLARTAGHTDEALQYFDELRHLDPGNEEIAQIMTELSAPAAEAPAPSPTPEAAPEEWEAPAAVEAAAPESAPEAALEFMPPAEEPAAIDLDWVPDQTSEGLPGDLAEFAGLTAGEAGADLPGFEMPDVVGELTADMGSLSSGFDEPPEDAGELPTFDVSFEQEPAEEEAPLPLEAFAFDEPEPLAEVGASSQAEGVTEIEFEPVAEVEPEPVAEIEPATHFVEFEEAEPAGEVLTETIAELYSAQGLHDRAAEVYRALLVQRPGDAALEARLREAEVLARPPQPTAPPAAAEPEPEPWELPTAPVPEAAAASPAEVSAPEPVGPQPTSEEIAPWLAAADAAVESPPTPYAWAETPAGTEPDTAPPIASYFQNLLAWRPRPGSTPAPPAEGAADELEMLLDEPAVEMEGFFEVQEPVGPVPPEPVAADPWLARTPPQIEEPWEPPPAAATPVAPAPAAAPAPAPAPVAGRTLTPPEAGSTADNAGDAFDEWFGSSEVSQAPSGAPAPAPDAEEPPQGGDDDDDLEMFRSWLQSLKK